MARKNNTQQLHAKLAHEIKSAKKKMFQRNREGMSAREAADKFCIDMVNRFEAVLGKREPIPDFSNLKRAMAEADRDRQAAKDPACDCPHPARPSCPVCDCPHCDIMPKVRERECPRCNYFHCAGKADDPTIVAGYTLLSDDELSLACARLGESLFGEYFIGLLILLLNHLVAVEVSDRNLEGAIIDIQEAVLRANTAATGFAVDALAAKTGKHLRLKTQGIDKDWNTGVESPEDDESVTATLPNGEKVELYGDAVDLGKADSSDFSKVLRALHELLQNPATPSDLFEHVAEFVTDTLNSTEGSDNIHHQPTVLATVLAACSADESMGAIRAARQAEKSKEAQS